MKSFRISLASFLLLAFAFVNGQDQAEMMKKWQEYMTPGQQHKTFEKYCGTWKAEITNYMDGQPSKAEGTAIFEMILGGRYMKSTFNSVMMGMPMEGFGLDAFDNLTKEYTSIWLDNFGTGVLIMKGKVDPATKTLTYYGNMVDPMTGKETKVKSVSSYEGQDKMLFEMFTVDGTKEIKNMSIVYTRSK